MRNEDGESFWHCDHDRSEAWNVSLNSKFNIYIYLFNVLFNTVEIEKFIIQIVEISEAFDQNSDRVSKNYKSCHTCSIRLKRTSSSI